MTSVCVASYFLFCRSDDDEGDADDNDDDDNDDDDDLCVQTPIFSDRVMIMMMIMTLTMPLNKIDEEGGYCERKR